MAPGQPGGSTKTKTDEQARTWLLPDQVDALLDACYSGGVPTYLQDRDHALVAVMYDLGLRRSEVAGLDVAMLDESARSVQLPSRIQKGDPPPARLEFGRYGADAWRPLQSFLNGRWKDSDAIFPSRQADRMTPTSVNNRIKTLAQIADVEPQLVDGGRGDPDDISSHTLRHSVAYRIIVERGERLEDVQLRLRHANRSTTDRIYSHLVPR